MEFFISTFIIIFYVIIIRIIKLPLNIINRINYDNNTYINIKDYEYNTDTCLVQPYNLKVISWNIQGLFIYSKLLKINNLAQCIKFLDADVICLQECFSNHIKYKLINNLNKIYPYALSGNLTKKFIIGEDSGLMVLSKYPIKRIHFEHFKYSCSIDSLSNKGFLVFNILGLNFINTHLQCNYNNKIKPDNNICYYQFKQLLNYINQNEFIKNNFLLVGDFNLNLNNIMNIINDISKNNILIKTLYKNNKKDTHMISNIDIKNNKYLYKEDDIIDYIFINNNNKYFNIINTDTIKLIDNPSDHNILISNISIDNILNKSNKI